MKQKRAKMTKIKVLQKVILLKPDPSVHISNMQMKTAPTVQIMKSLQYEELIATNQQKVGGEAKGEKNVV